ncbi:hypothetical protein ANN_09310 [Periplaneta americana]|uniref:Transposase Tc1-like domain-containing protein n=1 Tax=Periplaneta americana TaxID=6978 RepID=A0ABQ8TMG3_PERAM|nr:hypothetical protein ANN_09310 [Periplaneta americana]
MAGLCEGGNEPPGSLKTSKQEFNQTYYNESVAVPNNCPWNTLTPASSLDPLGNRLDAVNYYAEHYSKIMEVIDAFDSTDSSAVAAIKSLPSEQLLEDILSIDSNFKIVSKSIILLESSKLQLSEALNIVDKVSQTVIQNNNSLISEKLKLLYEMAKRKQLSEDLKKVIVQLALKGCVEKLRSQVQDTIGKEMSNQTIRRVLWKHGYHGRVPRKKPFISESNRIKRLLFANEHVSKEEDYWDRVIWSDETKINLFGSDSCNRVWRKAHSAFRKENTIPTVKHGGGSIMIWACMSSSGVGNIHFIDGIMDKIMYKNILMTNLKESAKKWASRVVIHFNIITTLNTPPESSRPG